MKPFVFSVVGQCVTIALIVIMCSTVTIGRHIQAAPKPCDGYLSKYCDCSMSQEEVITTAQCRNGNLSRILHLLPSSLITFSYTVDTFNADGVNFTKFIHLRKLELLWDRDPIDLPHAVPYNFTNAALFEGLDQLEYLRIGIPTVDTTPMLLHPLTRLKTIDFSYTGYLTSKKLATVYTSSRMSEKPLESIILSGMSGADTALVENFLLQDILPLFNGSNISTLDISNNHDIFIYPGLIKYLPNMTTLKAAGNKIRYKSKSLEANCMVVELALHESMQVLDLSGLNAVGQQIDFFAMQFMFSTFTCWASQPSENCICKTFNSMCSSLIGGTTPCDHIPDYKLDDILNENAKNKSCYMHAELPLPRSLETAYVNKTQFSFISGKFWEERVLCFKPNRLKSLDFAYITFPLGSTGGNFTIFGWENVTEMNVEASSWGSFFHNPKFLQTMPSLEILKLSQTDTGIYIRNDTTSQIFQNSSWMKELYLESTTSSLIPKYEFSPMKSLEKLHLRHNGLSSVSFDVRNLSNLRYIDLSNNEFMEFTNNVTTQLDEIASRQSLEINLSNNPLHCDCDTLAFVTWFQKTPITFTNRRSYLCKHPTSGSISLADISGSLLTLYCYRWYLIVSLSVFFVLASVAVGLIIRRCRRRIGYCCLLIKTRNELDDDVCDQDGFVIYADEDRFWVHDVMLDEVEKTMGLKLAVHHRDFTPGHYIDDQIVNFIHKSRKTIAILSESFLDSPWCDYELSVARHRLQSEGIDVIIPVILSDLPKHKISSSLQQILSEKTYLHWETSEEGKEYFWKKLRIAIRKRAKTRLNCVVNGIDIPRPDYNVTNPPGPSHLSDTDSQPEPGESQDTDQLLTE